MYNKDGTLTAIGKKVMDHGKKDKKPAVKEAKKKMVKDPKTGKMVPDYAADGKGKNDLKKESLQKRLAAKLAESKCCSDCGNPSYKNVSEEKKKGSHGKVCWKGYRRGKGNSCHKVKGDG